MICEKCGFVNENNESPEKTAPLIYVLGSILALGLIVIGVLFYIGLIDIPFITITRKHGEFEWQTDGGEGIRITGYTGKGGLVTIPAMINKKTVTAIGDDAFREQRLTGVNIPDSVISIGNNAFNSNELISVTIGANVSLGNDVFDFSRNSDPRYQFGRFGYVYRHNGMLAGTYTRPTSSSSVWSVLPTPNLQF